jgi:hypothetical protein
MIRPSNLRCRSQVDSCGMHPFRLSYCFANRGHQHESRTNTNQKTQATSAEGVVLTVKIWSGHGMEDGREAFPVFIQVGALRMCANNSAWACVTSGDGRPCCGGEQTCLACTQTAVDKRNGIIRQLKRTSKPLFHPPTIPAS